MVMRKREEDLEKRHLRFAEDGVAICTDPVTIPRDTTFDKDASKQELCLYCSILMMSWLVWERPSSKGWH